jgi:hypothetical protein
MLLYISFKSKLQETPAEQQETLQDVSEEIIQSDNDLKKELDNANNSQDHQ